MYIKYNGENYTCTCRPGSTMKYSGLPSDFPTPVSGEIQLCANDGFVLRTDIVEDYLRQTFSNGVLTLTNTPEPEPVPVPEPNIEEIRSNIINTISETCHNIITTGVDVEFVNGTEHFNLSIEDQSNINNLFRVVELGGIEFPYQSDGGVCRIYSADEIVQIYIAAQTLITTQTTYHNALKQYVQAITDINELNIVSYGMELPEPYLTEMNEKLAVAQEQMTTMISNMTSEGERVQ